MSDLTPYELVKQHHTFPPEIEDREYQVVAINDLAPLLAAGMYAEPCTGKTFLATVSALFKRLVGKNRTIVTMPFPILLDQWKAWLDSVSGITSVIYRGTPAQRKLISLDADFVVMSLPIFKNDFDYLFEQYEHLPVTLIVDEAHVIKNVASQNHKRVRDFSAGRDLMLLAGYPLSKPGDAYAYVKLVAPTVYRNQRHFDSLHVEEVDFFEKVTKWGNLEWLAENMMLNSCRILKAQALPYLKKPVYVPIHYQLDAPHAALYKKLATEQLLILENGGKIDATTPSRLYHALQQIVCNPGHFSGDPLMRSAAYELLDAVCDEIGVGDAQYGNKLMVMSYYRMTTRDLVEYLKPYGAVGFFSEVSGSQQQKNLRAFKEDPQCRIAVAQPESAGYGLEGLQKVCHDMLVLESPTVPKAFTQSVDRLYRDGQKFFPNIRMGIAVGTIQQRLHDQLLNADKLVNKVQGSLQDLREAIYGVS